MEYEYSLRSVCCLPELHLPAEHNRALRTTALPMFAAMLLVSMTLNSVVVLHLRSNAPHAPSSDHYGYFRRMDERQD
ncbi:hypothetical protein IQ06DRAFT_293589 [Phaeosphaeriaceae sp. SRC1lsM3a]|nr:hypothetical protein IQ06DRAFT_293589 [Stagonospora sp. SRC1lsM3a]